MTQRLDATRLATLAARATVPEYQRDQVRVGQLHLGVGAFHRAHQALYTEELLNRGDYYWGICGVSLRSPATRDRLTAQDLLYTVTECRDEHRQTRVVSALQEIIVAPEEPGKVIERIADPAISVITLTITEKGYALDPASGELHRASPEIVRDLQNPGNPTTALGYLAAGLLARRERGAGGMTLLSCDNLAANGKKLRSALLAFSEEVYPGLAEWIDDHCRFPCSMVDRIVPATTAADVERLAAAIGVTDEAAVITEPFRQWVIEDNFAGPVPDWGSVGATLVTDVAPFETMKLRLLNASHSCIAYLGCLAGFRTVADAVVAPGMQTLLQKLMLEEMAPTLEGLEDFDVDSYCDALLNRFANRGLAHHTAQIAMDGSQKIPQRLLPALKQRLAQGENIDASGLCLAAWFQYLRAHDDSGNAIVIDDPMAERFGTIAAAHGDDTAGYVDSLLGLEAIFDEPLATSTRLRDVLLESFSLAALLHNRFPAATRTALL